MIFRCVWGLEHDLIHGCYSKTMFRMIWRVSSEGDKRPVLPNSVDITIMGIMTISLAS